VQGFLHPEGVYDDPKRLSGGEVLLSMACVDTQFENEYKTLAEIHNTVKYSINVYQKARKQIKTQSDLFLLPNLYCGLISL